MPKTPKKCQIMKNKMNVYSIMHTTKVARWLTILMNCISVLDLKCFFVFKRPYH